MNRGGQLPGDEVLRARRADRQYGRAKLAGLMTWEGHCMKIADPVERDADIRSLGRQAGRYGRADSRARHPGRDRLRRRHRHLSDHRRYRRRHRSAGRRRHLGRPVVSGSRRECGARLWHHGAGRQPPAARPHPHRRRPQNGRSRPTVCPIPQNVPRLYRAGLLRRARQDHPRRALGRPRASATASSTASATPTSATTCTRTSTASATASSKPSGRSWPGAGFSKPSITFASQLSIVVAGPVPANGRRPPLRGQAVCLRSEA